MEKQEHQKRIDKLADVTSELRRAMRVEPLGEDRFHRLYWFFPGGMHGLYLSDRCVSASVVNPFAVGERIERWSYYNKEEDINQLLCALTVRGFREEKLKSSIRAQHAAIARSIKDLNKLEEEKKAAAEAERKLEEERRLEALKAMVSKKEVDKMGNGDDASKSIESNNKEEKTTSPNLPIPMEDEDEKTDSKELDENKKIETTDSADKKMEVDEPQGDAKTDENDTTGSKEEKMDTDVTEKAEDSEKKSDEDKDETTEVDSKESKDDEEVVKDNEDTVTKVDEESDIKKDEDQTKSGVDTKLTNGEKKEDDCTEVKMTNGENKGEPKKT